MRVCFCSVGAERILRCRINLANLSTKLSACSRAAPRVGVPRIPDGWAWERFVVVDGGDGNVYYNIAIVCNTMQYYAIICNIM